MLLLTRVSVASNLANLATPGRVLPLLKLKSKNESKNKQRKKYKVDLDPFDQPQTASIWREQHADKIWY